MRLVMLMKTPFAYIAAYIRWFFVCCIALVGYMTDWFRECLETESAGKPALMDEFVDDPTCSVTYDESLSYIFVVWKQYAPSSAQLRFVHECILHLLRKHGACKVLGDDTALVTLQPEDRSWIIQDWMPRALAAGLKFAASKTPDSYLGKASVRSVQAAFPAQLVSQTFNDVDTARQWLRSVSA